MSTEVMVSSSYYTPFVETNQRVRSVRVGERCIRLAHPGASFTRELEGMRDGVRVCSRLHTLVRDFHRAHAVALTDVEGRKQLASLYSITQAPAEDVDAIIRLSTPAVYAELRHGGRLVSPYPQLGNAELKTLCAEIRAALVWKTIFSCHT